MDTDPLSKSSSQTTIEFTEDWKHLDNILEMKCLTFLYFCGAEDADLTDKQKKQTLNPHIELREYFFLLHSCSLKQAFKLLKF